MNRNITATILIVLAAGIYVTYTSPKWAEVGAVRAVNTKYYEAISNADKLIAVRDQVLADYNQLSAADRDRLSKMIPATVDNIRLVIDANNVAAKHSLSLHNVSVQAGSGQNSSPGSVSAAAPAPAPIAAPSTTGPGLASGSSAGNGGIPTPTLDTVTISFSVTSSYAAFIQFMQDLEADLRITDLKHLKVSAGQNGQYDFSVDLQTYWLRQQ